MARAYLPTPFAALTPAPPPADPLEDLDGDPPDDAMAQSSAPDLDCPSSGKDTLLAC